MRKNDERRAWRSDEEMLLRVTVISLCAILWSLAAIACLVVVAR